MNNTYIEDYSMYIETDNIQMTFRKECYDARDIMSDSYRPDWMPTGEYYIHIFEVLTDEEIEELLGGVIATVKHYRSGRELAFRGDKKFAEDVHYIATKYDNFDTIVNAARVLMPQA